MKKLIDLNEGSRSFGGEVPWHSSYSKIRGNVGNETIVKKCIVCQTGLLLLGEDFKDYIYKGKRTYDQIIEALEYYVSRPQDSRPFVMESTKNKSSILGIVDDYEGMGVWMKDAKGYFFDSPQESLETDPSSNPFLPPTLSTPTSEKSSGTGKTKKTS